VYRTPARYDIRSPVSLDDTNDPTSRLNLSRLLLGLVINIHRLLLRILCFLIDNTCTFIILSIIVS
jgi:hypothetical protein